MLDATDVRYSSYLRWVNCARDQREENVFGQQCEDKVNLMTFKDIPPGKELLLYYGNDYAQYLEIDYNSDWH